MRYDDQPNPLRVLIVAVIMFWGFVYVGLKMFGII